MGSRRCSDCVESPIVTCGRCSATRCSRHQFKPGQRCSSCERDFKDEAIGRRAVKLIFAPALGVFSGGLFLALMMPIAGPFGALVVGTLACMLAFGSGYTMCALIDRSARAMFLRQTALGLPEARLLPPGKHQTESIR
jgi:hypothetical protein